MPAGQGEIGEAKIQIGLQHQRRRRRRTTTTRRRVLRELRNGNAERKFVVYCDVLY